MRLSATGESSSCWRTICKTHPAVGVTELKMLRSQFRKWSLCVFLIVMPSDHWRFCRSHCSRMIVIAAYIWSIFTMFFYKIQSRIWKPSWYVEVFLTTACDDALSSQSSQDIDWKAGAVTGIRKLLETKLESILWFIVFNHRLLGCDRRKLLSAFWHCSPNSTANVAFGRKPFISLLYLAICRDILREAWLKCQKAGRFSNDLIHCWISTPAATTICPITCEISALVPHLAFYMLGFQHPGGSTSSFRHWMWLLTA